MNSQTGGSGGLLLIPRCSLGAVAPAPSRPETPTRSGAGIDGVAAALRCAAVFPKAVRPKATLTALHPRPDPAATQILRWLLSVTLAGLLLNPNEMVPVGVTLPVPFL